MFSSGCIIAAFGRVSGAHTGAYILRMSATTAVSRHPNFRKKYSEDAECKWWVFGVKHSFPKCLSNRHQKVRRLNPLGMRLRVGKILAILMHEGAVQPYSMSLTPLPANKY